MSIVPPTNIGKLEFYEQHIQAWTDNAASLGVLPASCASLATLITGARAAATAAGEARDAARAATQTFYNGVESMHELGAEIIAEIKNHARSTSNPEVYSLAKIPPPKQPAPVPPPGVPEGFRVQLLQSGAVKLSWKCANPPGAQGTVYSIARRVGGGGGGGGGGAYTPIATVGERVFTDLSVPAGAASVSYRITAQRSTASGDPANFTVNFGVGDGGEMIIAGVKLAA